MKKAGLVALAALGFAACQDASVTAPALVPQEDVREYIPDQYIVVYRDGIDNTRFLTTALADRVGATVRYNYGSALRGFAGRMSADAAAELARHPSVAYVEQDQVVRAVGTQTGATWGLDRTDARSGLDGNYSYTNTGSGVTAYIIDTGIDYGHTEFGGRAVFGYDAFGGDGNDCNGHGTHVAGTVGGATYGIAKAVKLVAVRVLDCGGSGSWSGVVAGIDWVVSHHDAVTPAVSNMSLGGGANSTVDAAVNRMIDDNVASAVAAGNGNIAGIAQDACKSSPARVPRAMTIGATTKTDAKTSWSNYGKCVDWFAPGAAITSAWIGDGTTETNTISGTSMATPHVAGVAALYLQGTPGASAVEVRDALYAATTKNVVTSSKTTNNHLLFSNY